jgi:hypothetical protein
MSTTTSTLSVRDWYSGQGVMHVLVDDRCLSCGRTHPVG